jgi:hypothetical protein
MFEPGKLVHNRKIGENHGNGVTVSKGLSKSLVIIRVLLTFVLLASGLLASTEPVAKTAGSRSPWWAWSIIPLVFTSKIFESQYEFI